jgi:hypothetical protein
MPPGAYASLATTAARAASVSSGCARLNASEKFKVTDQLATK